MLRAALYDALRRVTPPRARRMIKQQAWFTPLAELLFSNHVYSRSYYRDVERIEAESVEHVADWITQKLNPRSVLDVGCGPGHLLSALRNRKVHVAGLDLSDEALRATREKGISAERIDLTDSESDLSGYQVDLVVCCEVAEHLKELYARNFARVLGSSGARVYLTAAEPDPTVGIGLNHYNEQPNSYWIRLLGEVGLRLNESETKAARDYLGELPVVTYLKRPLIFDPA